MQPSLLCAVLLASAVSGEPAGFRAEIMRMALRAPVVSLASASQPEPATPARRELAIVGRALDEETCRKPFQIVDAGERCTPPSDGQSLRQCKTPLRCIAGMCKRVKEGDFCAGDSMCDGSNSNIDLVCLDAKCKKLLESGEACSKNEQCFSGMCSKEGKCSGLAEDASCAFVPSSKTVTFQNPCGLGLHCALRGTRSDGRQDASCKKAAKLGEPCLGYALPIDPNLQVETPDWFLTAYVSSVYAACEPGLICEVRGFATRDASGRGSLAYAGTCRSLLHAPAGSECHSDMVCEPPYSCVGSVCSASPAECGEGHAAPGGDWDSPEEVEARHAALLNGCAANEKCSCPGGIGVCAAVHDECAAEEQRLVRCMGSHGCAWIDVGESNCADTHCAQEDIAFECCKYRGPAFERNVDWAAMEYVHGFDVQGRCSHLVTGTVSGLRAAERVVLELNGRDDLIVHQDGAFAFGSKLNHLDEFNVSVTAQPRSRPGCTVSHGLGVATDDVHDVLVRCGSGPDPHASGEGGAVAAGILLPCLLLGGCAFAAGAAVGRRNGGGAREGLSLIAHGAASSARNLPRNLPPVFSRRNDNASGHWGGLAPSSGYRTGGGDEYSGLHGMDSIPEATIVDATTGQPVVRASVA